MDKDANRLDQLDGLRGLAALSVFLFHTIELVAREPNARDMSSWNVLRPLWDGSAAVYLFFVLSGFVLALPYAGSSGRKIDPLPFVIRRIARLYPAYWVAILLSLGLRFMVFSPPGLFGLSPWINSLWHLPITLGSLLRHLLLIAPNLNTDQIDPVIWSLVAEMKVSLVFPAVLVLIQQTKKPWFALVALGLAIFCDAYFHIFGHLAIFLFGAYVAKYRGAITGLLGASIWLRIGLGICGYCLYGAASFFPPLRDPYLEITIAIGGCIFIVLFLYDGILKKVGRWEPVRFLGNVSYSFYLTHLPILLTVASLLYPRTNSIWLCMAVSLACSLGLSYAIFRLIEMPAHNWGRRQGKAIGRLIAGSVAVEQGVAP